MYSIAFTLGFFSSLHCVGMCGPLALAAQGQGNKNGARAWINSLLYNGGRITSYMLLGVFFGIFGTLLAMTGFQKGVSITAGVFLLLLFFFNVQPDQWLGTSSPFRKIFTWVQQKFLIWSGQKEYVSRYVLGILNGFLPCGMVYIALAGAISLQHIWGGMGFMLFFGLGTLPALVAVMLAGRWMKGKWRLGLSKIYPVVSLILGLYLIYRGIFSTTPLELNFYEALRNPVMCH